MIAFLAVSLHGLDIVALSSIRFAGPADPAVLTRAQRFIRFISLFILLLRTDRRSAILTRSNRSRAGAARTALIEPAHPRVASGDYVCMRNRRRVLGVACGVRRRPRVQRGASRYSRAGPSNAVPPLWHVALYLHAGSGSTTHAPIYDSGRGSGVF